MKSRAGKAVRKDKNGRWRDVNGRFAKTPKAKRVKPKRLPLRAQGRFASLDTVVLFEEAGLLTPGESKALAKRLKRDVDRSLNKSRKALQRALRKATGTRVKSRLEKRAQREFGYFDWHMEFELKQAASQFDVGAAFHKHLWDEQSHPDIRVAQIKINYDGIGWRTMGASDSYSSAVYSAQESTDYDDSGEEQIPMLGVDAGPSYGNAAISAIEVSIR